MPVAANGLVAFVNPPLAIGPHTLTAAYSGDTNHAAANSTQLTETIVQGTATALTASSTRSSPGSRST